MRTFMAPLLVLVVFALGIFSYGFFEKIEQSRTAAPDAERAAVQDYLSMHIGQLSPQPAVLGGSFHITNMAVKKGGGTVSYEDGHVAYTADFMYRLSPESGVEITSFTIRSGYVPQ